MSANGFALLEDYVSRLPNIVHVSSDYSGPRFFTSEIHDKAGFFPPPAALTAGKLMIPIGAPIVTSFNSREVFNRSPAEVDYTLPGTCQQSFTDNASYLMVAVDAAAVATPPFTVR